jgi:hypothetical protein
MNHYYTPAEYIFGAPPTEYGDGSVGVKDPRYLNNYRRSRRITGPLAKRIIGEATKSGVDTIYGGDFGYPDRLYIVPLSVLDRLDPRVDNPPRTWR